MRTMSGSPCRHYDCSNRNSFGYCRTTACINEHYQQEQWGSPSTTNKSESVVIKPQTNADRIRVMSDEELAEFFAQQEYRKPVFDGWLPLCNYVMGPRTCHENGCEKCWLDWLKQGEVVAEKCGFEP